MDNIREIQPDEEARLKSLVDTIKLVMPLHEWGFELSARFIARFRPNADLTSESRFPTVIYDSEYCRVLFSLRRDFNGYELMVAYGRSYAPDDEQIMKRNGEDCYCWHWNVYDLICKFLDGMSSQEAVASRGKPPKGLDRFLASVVKNAFDDIEFPLIYHREIWKYYGKSLFELFDVRHPQLWEAYTQFVKEYYDRYRRSRNISPSLDKIC